MPAHLNLPGHHQREAHEAHEAPEAAGAVGNAPEGVAADYKPFTLSREAREGLTKTVEETLEPLRETAGVALPQNTKRNKIGRAHV